MIVADTFLASARRLKQAADLVRALDFMAKFAESPSQPGLSLERVKQARDKNVWAARVSHDLRAILHKDGDTWSLLYVDHHDAAYDWASRRTVERHAHTGALQVVVAPEVMDGSLAAPPTDATPALLAKFTDAHLLSLAVPESWLPALRQITTEDQLQQAAEHLPAEVGERLLCLHAGEFVAPPRPVPASAPAMASEDSQRRFYVLDRDETLRAILAAPLAQWLVFLHPSQRALAAGSFNGPVKVTGSAGTGKTVVAMHRAAHLAAQGKRVLLTSFLTTLCKDIERNMRLFGAAPGISNVRVLPLASQALEIVRQADPSATPVVAGDVAPLLERALSVSGLALEKRFLLSEWHAVIEPNAIRTWDAYRDVSRAGRRRPLSVKQRKEAWTVFGDVIERLDAEHRMTFPHLCGRAADLLSQGTVAPPYDAVLVDELQDLDPPQLRFVCALAGDGPDRLMLVGDAGQRIYGPGISLLACGINVRGRSHILRVNYRTTEQIRRQSDRLLGSVVEDFDGGTELRSGTRSLLRGPDPVLRGFKTAALQAAFIVEQIRAEQESGVSLTEMAVFARTNSLVKALDKALREAGLATCVLSAEEAGEQPGVRLGTMHRAKGLEFKVVFVADAGDLELPSPSALKAAEEPADRDDLLKRERHLLYVSMTRARDELYVTWVGQPCAFLQETGLVVGDIRSSVPPEPGSGPPGERTGAS